MVRISLQFSSYYRVHNTGKTPVECLWPAGIPADAAAVAHAANAVDAAYAAAAVAVANAAANAAAAVALAVGQHGVGRLLLHFSSNSQQ